MIKKRFKKLIDYSILEYAEHIICPFMYKLCVLEILTIYILQTHVPRENGR